MSALFAIVQHLHLGIIEQLGDSASLYGSSIASHHVCILVKAIVSTHNYAHTHTHIHINTYTQLQWVSHPLFL